MNTQTNYIYHIKMSKINILKINNGKKWKFFLLDMVNLQKQFNRNRDTNISCVEVVEFVMIRA